MKSSLGPMSLVLAAVLCSPQSTVAQLLEPDRVGWQPHSFACADTSPPLVFTKQDFEKGFDKFYKFPNVTECDGYEAGVSDFRERGGSLRLTYDPAALDPMTAEVRYRERYSCGEGEGMAEHSFEWSGSLQPVDEDPDGIFPAAGFDGGMEEPARFIFRPCGDFGEGRPPPWVSVYLGLVYRDDATGKLVRSPFLQLDGGPSGVGKVAFGPVPEEEEYEVEVAVTPEPRSDYETWRPRGNLDPSIPGNQLTVHVKVHEKDDPDVPRRASLRFAFRDVSREPGVCLNWPVNGADTKPDLKLRFADESLGTPSADGTSIETNGLVKELDLIVESYDFGAWGTLRISGTDKDKNPVTVKVMGKGTPDLTLPLDDDGNRIADAWAPDIAGGKPADSDDEHQDGNPNDGDGLTLYEEYRGFVEAGRHTHGHPADKDFFVVNLIGEEGLIGLNLFETAAHLEVHSKLSPEELNVFDRVINRNSSAGLKQHGVVLGWYEPDPGYSKAVGGPGPPGKVSKVLISRKKIADKSPAAGSRYTSADVEIAHELAHAVNVWHHGEDDWDVVWQSALPRKEVREVNNAGVIRWVRVLGENGRELTPDQLGRDGMQVRIGRQHGEHSGAEECLMRYAYDGNLAYESLKAQDEWRYLAAPQQTGVLMCRSPSGTGVNAKDRLPQPAWGNAAAGRGNCFGQITVSDRAASGP